MSLWFEFIHTYTESRMCGAVWFVGVCVWGLLKRD